MKGKKVLLVGLGILGGGVATARFLLRKGARLTITDKRDKTTLAPSIARLPSNVSYTIGIHKEKDFQSADVVVANPAVPRFGEWIMFAEKLGKTVYNDLTLFLSFFQKSKRDYIAVTGTRGKTTSSLWISNFIQNSVLGGNIPEKALLKILSHKGNPFVLETSSFQLEYMNQGLLSPKVALITNLYQDHLNRHKTMEEYVRVKSNIFLNQTETDFLILNYDSEWTMEFLSHKPKSSVYYISAKVLPKKMNGLFLEKDIIVFQEAGVRNKIARSPFMTNFENSNLFGAMLASFLYMRSRETGTKKTDNGIWKEIVKRISQLPQASMRREVIVKRKNLTVVNDSAGTSPEATIALLDSYRTIPKKEKILITGGTDKELDFTDWAKVISNQLLPQNIYFVSGSATEKMKQALKKYRNYNWQEYNTLKEVLTNIKKRKEAKTILFSPSSASFEKYKNEFDRGKIFARFIQQHF